MAHLVKKRRKLLQLCAAKSTTEQMGKIVLAKDIDGSRDRAPEQSVRSPFWGGDLPEVRTASRFSP